MRLPRRSKSPTFAGVAGASTVIPGLTVDATARQFSPQYRDQVSPDIL